MTIAPARPNDRITIGADGRLRGCAVGVPFAEDCEHIAVLADGGERRVIALVDVKDCQLSEGRNLAGDAVNAVSLDGVKPQRRAAAPNWLR